MTALLEARVALAVAYQCRGVQAQRTRRRRPYVAGFLVAQIHHLGRWVDCWIIAPRRQPILLTIAGPGVAQAALGNEETNQWIGHHVDPRGGWEVRPQLESAAMRLL